MLSHRLTAQGDHRNVITNGAIGRDVNGALAGWPVKLPIVASYELQYLPERISPAEVDKKTTLLNHLVLVCDSTPDQTGEYVLFHRAAALDTEETEQAADVHVMQPLRWRRPKEVLIKNWACSTFYRPLQALGDQEQACVVHTWAQAGFNTIGTMVGQPFIDMYGWRKRKGIPLVTAPGHNFPGGKEYLAAHPEARAAAFNGRTYTHTFCPTYYLSDANEHLADVRKWLGNAARENDIADWDYDNSRVGTRNGQRRECSRQFGILTWRW